MKQRALPRLGAATGASARARTPSATASACSTWTSTSRNRCSACRRWLGARRCGALRRFRRSRLPARAHPPRRTADRRGARAGRGGARPPAAGPVCLLTQPALLRLGVQSAELLLLLRAPTARLAGDGRRGQQHAVARAPPLRAAGRPRHRPTAAPPRVAKSFHVSPFLPMRPGLPHGASPAGRAPAHPPGELARRARSSSTPRLGLRREPLDRASLHRHLLAFPWMTGKIVAGHLLAGAAPAAASARRLRSPTRARRPAHADRRPR